MNVMDNDWMNATFDDWFQYHLLPVLRKKDGKKVVIGDNFSAHITVKTLKLCKENNIRFVCLVPNSTHLLQPLDVSFFAALKNNWRKVLFQWRQTLRGKKIANLPCNHFAQLLKKALNCNREKIKTNVISGFRATGIYPFCPENVIAKLPTYTRSPDELQGIVGEQFKNYIEGLRNSDLYTVKRGRKFQLPVMPGKSVSLEEVENFYKEKEAKPTSAKKRRSPLCSIENVPDKKRCPARQNDSDKANLKQHGELESSKDGQTSTSVIIVDHLGGNITTELVEIECLPQENYLEGDFVIIQYEGEYFPACVTQVIGEGQYRVSAMQRTGGNWKWPNTKDEIIYSYTDILKKIVPDNIIPATSRGVFKITDTFLCDKWQAI